MESLRQAAIQLVNDHLELKLLLNEVSRYSLGVLQENSDEAAVSVTMDTLQHWSDTTNQPISLVASCHALEQLKLLSNNRDSGVCDRNFFTVAQKKEVLILCKFIQNLMQKKFFDRRHFVCGVYNTILLVPMEMFWVLFKSRVITIQDLSYTSGEASEKFWRWLGDQLGDICASSPSDCVDVQREIVQGISVTLVELVYQEDECNHYTQPAMDCLKGLILRSHDFKDDCINSYSVITALRDSHLTHPQHLREMLVQVMKGHFYATNNNTTMTAMEAFSLQELWKFASLSKTVVNFYSEVCEVLDISDCGILLSAVISHDEMAWKNILEFVSSLINLKATINDEFLKKFLKEQVILLLTNCSSHQLQSTLLLARQCSSEGSHLFPSYYNWLQDAIGGGAGGNVTPITKRSAQFLIKTFTDLIPHEISSYLQVHAKFLRKYLSKYKMSVDHFMTVALTRLKDLGVGDIELSDGKGFELGKVSLSDYDVVEQALKQFEQSKDVPSSVMRMSILHPQRFVNSFLPLLLAPRVQPGTPDSREKFIQKLNQLKKIPTAMFNFYETECKRQRDQSLNRSTVTLGDNNELTLALQRFMDCIKHNLSASIAPSLSVLSTAITATCHRHGNSDTTLYSDDQPAEQLDLNNPSLYKWQIELVDAIISALCSSVTELYHELESSNSDPLRRFFWLNLFLEMFSSHAMLHRCWFVRLWELLYVQGGDLLEGHITGLAVLLVHMSNSQCAYQRLQLTGPLLATCDQKGKHFITGLAQYSEHLLECLGGNSKEWPCNSLSLLCQMLRHATVIIKRPLPRTALVKFQYFYSYLSFFYKEDNETVFSPTPAKRPKTAVAEVLQLADVLLKEPEVVDCLSNNKLTLKEWLLLELSHSSVVDHDNEQCLSSNKRYAYRCHMLQGHSSSHDPNVASHDPSFSHDHTELFTALLTTLIQLHSHTTRINQCWEDGVSLLQDQTLSLPSQQPHLILPSAIKAALKDKASTDAVWCCFRIVSMLPHHLFFCNDPSEVTDMKQSFDVLQTCWAAHLLGDDYVLPFDMTRYLYKGVQAASRNFSGCVVSTILDNCPLLFSSFLVWWPQLKHLGCKDSQLVHSIDSLSSIINKPSTATLQQDLLVTHNNISMAIGVCMYHDLTNSNKLSDDFLYKLNVLFHEAECRKQVLITLLYCAVYHCGWYKNNVNTLQLIETLIYTDPELLCPLFEFDDFSGNDDGLVDFLKQFHNYFPTNFDLNNATLFVLYFRLMSMFKSSLLLKLVQCHEVLQLTLNMYDKYSLYKDTDNDYKWVLSLIDISLITTVFQNVIQLLPDHLLMETQSTGVRVSEKVKSYCKREMQIRNLYS